ncbi:MAG TPA: hypothetical protein VFW86_01465, partial [Candidatus Limnocylindrales bacterium]|nr:hypothetical protein [Candidatus Limnocylindrales bacterium]
MPVQVAVGIAFVVLVGCLVAVFLTVALEGRRQSWDEVYETGGRVRRWWFGGLLVFGIIVFALSMTWLPYAAVRQVELPGQATRVDVTAEQFDFKLSSTTIPADHPIEFHVGSKDVNHGFAIYDASGRIVGQTQAMPGFENVLRVSLPAGTYTLHCDELCGPGHPFMTGTFTVGGNSAGGGGGVASGAGAGCAGSGCASAGCGGG